MTKDPVLVDTNIALAANGAAEHADADCILKCINELDATQSDRQLLLDDGGRILDEYLSQRPHGFPQEPGDAFIVWAITNQANPEYVTQVPITPVHGPQGFREFPTDPELRAFDRSDRKFVAVALASGLNPKILNATDTDWWIHRGALDRNGVHVEFLCPQLMRTRG